ncbi:hypothetical protein Xen7305DRAFT_00021990 [Xenococcus sp. PCC 7305]|uniref:hypothetical protein n=1 Tax=Xenococcus sp. PCC 7305 TaxID=102125 RepID=UPI0002ACDA81|nr:hypothetical protein [Xenococcus sp. PCC 7305]ELS02485.1 hypothetical protein Xen7305DRAFT_00021990 [Xenococcus sp. PCC 7305]
MILKVFSNSSFASFTLVTAYFLSSDPADEGGIFNASYGAIAQIVFSPSERFDVALTYVHSRDQSDTETGSNLANLQSFPEDEFDEAVPTVSDSYGVEFA